MLPVLFFAVLVVAAVYLIPLVFYQLGGVPGEARALAARYPLTSFEVYQLAREPEAALPPWVYRAGDWAFVPQGLPADALEGIAVARGVLPSLAFRSLLVLPFLAVAAALFLPAFARRLAPEWRREATLAYAAAATLVLASAAFYHAAAFRPAPELQGLWSRLGDAPAYALEVPGASAGSLAALDTPPERTVLPAAGRTWVLFAPEAREAFLELAGRFGPSAHPLTLQPRTRVSGLLWTLALLGVLLVWIGRAAALAAPEPGPA